MNYTYIVQCSDGTLYTGWTNDLNKRIKAHNNGKGAKYTKPRLPVELVYAKEHATKEEAMKDEYRIKQLSRKRKQELCKEYEEEQRELQEEHPEQAVSSEEKSSGNPYLSFWRKPMERSVFWKKRPWDGRGQIL